MAPVQVYVYWTSAPCRAVAMACRIAGIDCEFKVVQLFQGEHKKEWFLKINPDHCVPTIDDNGFCLWESRPVAIYLLDKHAPDHPLFPKDLQKRAHIQRMLDFDLSVLYKNILGYMVPRIFQGVDSDPAEMEKVFQRLNDTVFNDKQYATGDTMTLADLFLISSITFTEIADYEVSPKKFPNLAAWVKRMKESDFYKAANVEFEEMKGSFIAERRAAREQGKF